jgi:hypothetical protein
MTAPQQPMTRTSRTSRTSQTAHQGTDTSSRPRAKSLNWATRWAAAGSLVSAVLLGALAPALPAYAAFDDAGSGNDVVIGRDDDNPNNPLIQPPNTAANQSLNNTDVMFGGSGNDVLLGLLGSDVMFGDSGNDILVGGTEQGQAPNSDIMFGDSGDDVSIWAPGDGSDAFFGGSGRDAEVFGVIDRDANNVPTRTGTAPGFLQGIPTANVTGSPGFCTLEQVNDPNLGYDYLARFFVRATGNLAVTVRLKDTEQVYCTSQAGGQITYADLRQPNAQFQVVTLQQVQQLNPLVARIIR